ncbi:hypothetical protein CDAR_456911 [Caerostris darwini]|uniref:Uncharacterized protein n=1 Tax=Caerostris darwini TaxID=1538125 RepID=A0AAV4T732_9ARAC|nr:hypothetical protein CDAR_456911 [Caerostris darwini]
MTVNNSTISHSTKLKFVGKWFCGYYWHFGPEFTIRRRQQRREKDPRISLEKPGSKSFDVLLIPSFPFVLREVFSQERSA